MHKGVALNRPYFPSNSPLQVPDRLPEAGKATSIRPGNSYIQAWRGTPQTFKISSFNVEEKAATQPFTTFTFPSDCTESRTSSPKRLHEHQRTDILPFLDDPAFLQDNWEKHLHLADCSHNTLIISLLLIFPTALFTSHCMKIKTSILTWNFLEWNENVTN